MKKAILASVVVIAFGVLMAKSSQVDNAVTTQHSGDINGAASPVVQPTPAAALPFIVPTPEQMRGTVTESEVRKIISEIPKHSDWKRIDIWPADPKAMTIKYDTMPTDAQVELDAEMVVTKVIQGLVANGHDPQKESLSVYVWTEQDNLVSVTGKLHSATYGDAYYNWVEDRIVWQTN